MIYTVTFNPSLDYVVRMKEFATGEINWTQQEHIYPGGKGNNVSVVLSNLGVKSRALGFKAGMTGDSLEKMLKEHGIDTDFIALEKGFTRINVKINAGEETAVNGQGPAIPPEAITLLYEKLDRLEREDILVLAGSIPNTLSGDIYEKIMERLCGRGIRFVVDAAKELLVNVLKYRPFLIKPNNYELGDIFGKTLKTEEEIVFYAGKLQEQGAGNVLVSMAEEGAILLTEEKEIYRSLPPRGEVVNSAGAGDSMVAGFLAGYLDTGNMEKAFRLGLAAGSASAFCSWLAEREEIMELLEGLEPVRKTCC